MVRSLNGAGGNLNERSGSAASILGGKTLNFQLSYALSRFDNSGGATSPDDALGPNKADQDYIVPALDNRNPNQYFGPSTLDRTHQLSVGGYLDFVDVIAGGSSFLRCVSHFS